MRRYQFIGGLILLAGAAGVFLALDCTASIAIATTRTVVAAALVAQSRRKAACSNPPGPAHGRFTPRIPLKDAIISYSRRVGAEWTDSMTTL